MVVLSSSVQVLPVAGEFREHETRQDKQGNGRKRSLGSSLTSSSSGPSCCFNFQFHHSFLLLSNLHVSNKFCEATCIQLCLEILSPLREEFGRSMCFRSSWWSLIQLCFFSNLMKVFVLKSTIGEDTKFLSKIGFEHVILVAILLVLIVFLERVSWSTEKAPKKSSHKKWEIRWQ